MLGESKLAKVTRRQMFGLAGALIVVAAICALLGRVYVDLVRMFDGYGAFFALVALLIFVVALNRER
ncbi:MAG: hypothetical protein ACYDCK_12830 [Thermoplasmatota archaeon]